MYRQWAWVMLCSGIIKPRCLTKILKDKMKIYSKIFTLMALAFAVAACEKNDVLPDYELVGTATSTIADISVSNSSPLPGEEVIVTFYYVNLASDPATEIELLEQIGSGDFTSETTLDESSAATGEEITRTYTYTVPDLEVGTEITLDMVLSSQNREFPQRERVNLEISEPEEE